jgi:hypothetical protein
MGILINGEIAMQTNLSLPELYQFTGSEQFFKHGINSKLIYTEGVKYLAEKGECYWLIDEIAMVFLPYLLKKHKDWFYSVKLLVTECGAVITVDDGNDKILINHKIESTDFPIVGEPIKFFLCESEEYYCLMLSREY